MNLLALETATEACSVALLQQHPDGSLNTIARRQHAPRQQTQLILPMVDAVLAEAGLSLRELDAIAYSCGPGAFTGVRIAAAVAQGLALGADLPVVAVSSLRALAQSAWRQRQLALVAASFDARMQEIYLGLFRLDAGQRMQPVLPELACRPAQVPEQARQCWQQQLAEAGVEQGMAIGSGWATYADLLQAQLAVVVQLPDAAPDAADVAWLALPDVQAGRALPPELALPVYLRDDVWQKLPGR